MTAPTDTSQDHVSESHMLAPILDQYAEWFGRVLRHAFYVQAVGPLNGPPPASFGEWVAQADPDMAEAMNRLHTDMETAAQAVLMGAPSPDMAAFDAFVQLYEEFVLRIHRLERDSLLQDSGVDLLTGLRSRKMMMPDLDREMERRARRGQPFCLALVRIDHFDAMQKSLDKAALDHVLQRVSAMIKKTIRSFDDAYRLDNGEFMMSLKQADSAGGAAGINRLRRFMEEEDLRVPMKGRNVSVTLSCCVGEPQPGDDLDALMDHMRDDLERFGTERNTAVEYVDISPLERFVHAMDEPKGDGGSH